MSSYLNEEAMGVNHVEQQQYRDNLLAASAGASGDMYDLGGSDEFGQSPEMVDDVDTQSAHSSSRQTSNLSQDDDQGLAPLIGESSRLEPSAKQLASLRSENNVPLSYMDDASTATRNQGFRRAGIHPTPRKVPEGYYEAMNQSRKELRPLTMKARAVDSARGAVDLANPGRLKSSSLWGRFKDKLRGFALMQGLGMDSHETVQARRRERLMQGRMEASRSTSRFAALTAGQSSFPKGTRHDARWGRLEPTAGAAIPEVDESEEDAE